MNLQEIIPINNGRRHNIVNSIGAWPRSFIGLLVVLSLGSGLLAFDDVDVVEGSGRAATKKWAVTGTTEVWFASVGDLVATAGDKDELRISADDNILPLLEVSIKDGVLTLGIKPGSSFRTKTPIKYQLTIRKKLTRFGVIGSGNATIDGSVVAENFDARVSGSGDLAVRKAKYKTIAVTVSGSGNATAEGTAGRLTAAVDGSGDVNASELKVTDADVRINGSGDATVWVTKSLIGMVNGSGNLTYKGNPGAVQAQANGSGAIRALDR